MNTIKCPNCGHQLPEDSAFCNKCGSRINTSDYSSRREPRRDYEDWSDEPEQREPQSNDKGVERSYKTLLIVVGIAVAALISIFAINKCFFSGNKENTQEAVTAEENSNAAEAIAAASDAFRQTLNENHYDVDGERIVYALRIDGTERGKNDKIIGITLLPDKFYKLYELVQNGDSWKIDPKNIQKVDIAGNDVKFDQDQLKTSIEYVPQKTVIDGRSYFFYAYLSSPRSNPSNASVVLNLYDVQSRNITKMTYDGTYQDINGERVIVCNPATTSNKATQWMDNQARLNIRILSIKGNDNSSDILDATEPTTTQEQQVTDPAATPQATPSQQASVGQDKDSPMFHKDDIVETKKAGRFTVFRLKDGSVVRYDSSTGKNPRIHSGGAEAIGFEDTEKGILNIRKSDGSREQVDLNNGQHTSKPAASKPAAPAQPEKKEDAPKP